MINLTCPACGETLDIPEELVGESVRCGNCQTVFTTPTGTGGTVPVARRANDLYDEDRKRVRRANRGVPIWIWIVLFLMGLGTCGCCGGFVFLMVEVMNPEFQPYQSPDGRWEGMFPGKVTVGKRATGRANAEMAVSSEAKREIFGSLFETFFVYEVELTAGDKRKRPAEVADELCQALALTEPGKVVMNRAGRSHQGHEAAEIGMELADGRSLMAKAVIAHGRGYVVGVIGPGKPGQAPWVDEFIDSFSILDPNVEKGKDEEGEKTKDVKPGPAVEKVKEAPAKEAAKEPAEAPAKEAAPRREAAPKPRVKMPG